MYREGNHIVDKIDNVGLQLSEFTLWFGVPDIAGEVYRKNLFNVYEFGISDWKVIKCAPSSKNTTLLLFSFFVIWRNDLNEICNLGCQPSQYPM